MRWVENSGSLTGCEPHPALEYGYSRADASATARNRGSRASATAANAGPCPKRSHARSRNPVSRMLVRTGMSVLPIVSATRWRSVHSRSNASALPNGTSKPCTTSRSSTAAWGFHARSRSRRRSVKKESTPPEKNAPTRPAGSGATGGPVTDATVTGTGWNGGNHAAQRRATSVIPSRSIASTGASTCSGSRRCMASGRPHASQGLPLGERAPAYAAGTSIQTDSPAADGAS